MSSPRKLHDLSCHRYIMPFTIVCGGGSAYSFAACLTNSHLTIDHASLSRRSTVSTPTINRGISNTRITLFPKKGTNNKRLILSPRRRWPSSNSKDSDRSGWGGFRCIIDLIPVANRVRVYYSMRAKTRRCQDRCPKLAHIWYKQYTSTDPYKFFNS